MFLQCIAISLSLLFFSACSSNCQHYDKHVEAYCQEMKGK